ncbi:hypothetical protein PPERSA_02546 [Pseudocohnilembus persalinus]|uniref:Tetratricopeptide repeat protein n=1 Tax=Pseudocohnilembus persalinus TaxID=266149 RepID=A0A0V0R5P0_PSEPJ|nr:hypothetical protein PPERSA_02546 [Pseudocohnilembus persalinus]|eukprot:KRX09674.1 hypothetical protein PPERSA_02546 [Pseudocohnilembus persalinus]
MAHCYQDIQEYKKALEQNQSSLQIYQFNNAFSQIFPEILAQILNNTASVYQQEMKLDLALERYLSALKINEVIHLQNSQNKKIDLTNLSGNSELAINLTNISTIYRDLEDYKSAIQYGEQALQTFLNLYKQNQKLFGLQLATAYGNLSVAYQCQEKFEKALEYSEKSLKIFEQNKPLSLETAHTLFNLSCLYEQIEDYQKSLQRGMASLAIQKHILVQDIQNNDEVQKQQQDLNQENKNQNSEQNGQQKENQNLDLHYQQKIYFKILEQVEKDSGKYELHQQIYDIEITKETKKFFENDNVLALLEHIGGLYYFIEDFKRSIEIYEKAFDVREQQPPCEETIILSNNLVLSLQEYGDNSTAQFYSKFTKDTEKKLKEIKK